MDFSHGVELYRANVYRRMRRPAAGRTEVPVQLIVPMHDRYVTPALLDGLEAWTSLMWRRPVDAGHWVIRTNPTESPRGYAEVVSFVEDGVESDALRGTDAVYSARSMRAVGVRAAVRAGTAATRLASTRVPTATRSTDGNETVGYGTA